MDTDWGSRKRGSPACSVQAANERKMKRKKRKIGLQHYSTEHFESCPRTQLHGIEVTATEVEFASQRDVIEGTGRQLSNIVLCM